MSDSTATPKYTPKNTVKDLNIKAREALLFAASDPVIYKSLLETIAKFPSYSAMNATHIVAAAPDASVIKDSEAWNKEGNYIKKGEQGIPVTFPERNEKTGKTYFNVKYLYADTQMSRPSKNVENAFDMKLLEQAFADTERTHPTSPEGKFIVGKHFGLGAYLKDDVLPPTDLMTGDTVEEVCANIKSYVDNIRYDAYKFIRSVDTIYKELVAENVQEKNSKLFQAYVRAGEREAIREAPTQEQSEQVKNNFDATLDAAEATAQTQSEQEVPVAAKKDDLNK